MKHAMLLEIEPLISTINSIHFYWQSNQPLPLTVAPTDIISVVYDLTMEIANLAGRTRKIMKESRPRFGLADAIIFETGQAVNAPVVTGDPHFKGLPDVIYIGN